MTASQFVQANLAGEILLAGQTQYFALQSNLEATGIAARAVTKIREAGVLDLAFLRISVNSLSGDCVYVLQKNGVDQALKIRVRSRGTGAFHDDSRELHLDAGDEVGWKVAAATGSGAIRQTMAGLRFRPDNRRHCVTFLSTFAASSLAVSDPGATLFLAPSGTRARQTVESKAHQRIQEPAIWRGLYVVPGTNYRTAETTIGHRKNGVDQVAQKVVISGLDNAIHEDNEGAIALAAGDDFNYVLRTGPRGRGTYNLERINSELVSTNHKFFLFTNRPGGASFTAARYIPIAGDFTSSPIETEAELVVKFPFRLDKLIAKVLSNTGSIDGAVLRVRKNRRDTPLEVLIHRETGILTDNDEFVDLEPGDRVCFQLDEPSGTVNIQYIGIVGDATLSR